ncbi:MAG: hypothetical protein AYK19_17480 [Theionarchaea archaeon DG-70-1]|nr:MAG: hypothetical protein AYK19_17480 [Theionarchaea archaeon DG-70-1]
MCGFSIEFYLVSRFIRVKVDVQLDWISFIQERAKKCYTCNNLRETLTIEPFGCCLLPTEECNHWRIIVNQKPLQSHT